VRFIAVKDFEHFQHYKGRTPPWIKFYNALLDDYRFLQLSDAARSQLMLIWLVASRHKNRIPNDPKYITQAIHCTTKLQLGALIDSGWLYLAEDAPLAEREQDASKALAERPQSAIPEKEREVEVEKETEETTTYNSSRAAFLEKLPERYKRDAESFLRSLGSIERQYSWVQNFEAKMDGMHPPVVSAAVVGSAIRQLVANGERPNWKRFEGYLRAESAPIYTPSKPADAKSDGLLIVGELRTKRVHHPAPQGSGVYVIDRAELTKLSDPVRRAVDAIGGLHKIANHSDENFPILASQFAAMYTAALNKSSEASAA
jgi:hypothetical protein